MIKCEYLSTTIWHIRTYLYTYVGKSEYFLTFDIHKPIYFKYFLKFINFEHVHSG